MRVHPTVRQTPIPVHPTVYRTIRGPLHRRGRRFEAFGRVWGLRATGDRFITHHTCVVSYTEIGGAPNGASAVWFA